MKKLIGYKILTKNLKAPNIFNRSYSYEGWEKKSFRVEGGLELCRNGLHVYKSLNNVTIGNFGERVFKVEIIGKYIEDENKYCCKEIKILKELDAEEVKDSRWAYRYCRDVEDREEVRKNIKDSVWAYYYCRDVK